MVPYLGTTTFRAHEPARPQIDEHSPATPPRLTMTNDDVLTTGRAVVWYYS